MSHRLFKQCLAENPVVITGLGAFCGAGINSETLWQNAVAGPSPAAWTTITHGGESERIAVCAAPSIQATERGYRIVRKMDRSVQLALAAANQAWDQAQLDHAPVSPERVGIIIGTSRGPLHKWAESLAQPSRKKLLPSLAANSTLACLSGALSQIFQAHGPCFSTSAACASGAAAIALGAQQIATGAADLLLVGGTEATLHPLIISQLSAAGVLGFHEDPKQTCRPFDATRNGMLLGEGAAFLVLESASHARQRGAKALAQLAGWAIGVESSGRAGVTENGDGLFQVMQTALELANISPAQIDYFNTHGTGTVVNDRAEARALIRLLCQSSHPPVASSTKPVTGHCLGASPALEAVISIQSLRHQLIPPTLNYAQPDPACPLDVVPSQARPAKLRYVMSNSLGFWGNNASLIFAQTG